MVPSTLKMPYSTGWHFIPNIFIRSAAFHGLLPGLKRKIFKDFDPQVIPSLSNYKLTQHTGEQLAQNDLDALLGVTAMIAYTELNAVVAPEGPSSLRLRPLLFACRRTDNKGNREKLLENLNRLASASFTAVLHDYPNADFDNTPWPLIEMFKAGEDEADKNEVTIKISKAYRELLQLEHTGISSHEREQLTQDGQWLHAFFSSHKQPRPYSPLKLGQLIGRTSDQVFGFEPTLVRQLKTLSKVTGWTCAMEKGMASVKKTSKGKGFSLKRASPSTSRSGSAPPKANTPDSQFEKDEV